MFWGQLQDSESEVDKAVTERILQQILRRTMDFSRIPACFTYTVLLSILFVIIPQAKHASSLATAATATFCFLPCRIIR